ncbi:hypothetical protein CAter282_1155 [Collimonas arenae]|uniref:DUF2007 domain-containing protein n=1 Tax=Collimonas arenae TaxID=279058 RepID=A0A127PMM1_9BURK|nr:hypothetical protein [Collimonas arenae]AMO99050.1 hypothetical protein CAter10_1249 [Collimonas arenae]AMP08947.1 hypothetical protein CAter282_1155 [Collimonas arenae]
MANTGYSSNPGDFETIARSTVPSELAVMQALLESERIPAFIVDGGIHQLHFLIAVATGGARLQVASEYAAAARRILADLATGQLMLEEDDKTLHEPLEEKGAVPENKRRGRALGAALLFFLGGS